MNNAQEKSPAVDLFLEYPAVFDGESYTLSLRTCADGFLPGWLRNAAQVLVERFQLTANLNMTDQQANQFFSLIIDKASEGIVRCGARYVPIPWESWLDLDADLLETIVRDFFVYACAKTRRQKNSALSMRFLAVMNPMCDLLIATTSDLYPLPEPLRNLLQSTDTLPE